jgi:hypothetical protein
MMNYFSITPPPNLIAPNNRIAPPPRSSPVEPPHIYPLRRVRVFLVACCVWLSGHSKDFFFLIFLSRSVCRPERRDIPTPHASTTPPSTRHRREQRRRRRRSSRRRQVAQSAPAPPATASEPTPPPFRPRRGGTRRKRAPTRARCAPTRRGVSARRLERGAPRRIPRIKNGDS